MARLRDDYPEFVKRGAEVIAIGPDNAAAFQRYWESEKIPFIGLPNPDKTVLNLYRQPFKYLKLGRLPLNCVLDVEGRARYFHYGSSMRDIPDDDILLDVIDKLKQP